MKKFLLIFIVWATGVFSQQDSDFGFPVPIDLSSQRQLMAELFPQVDSNLPRLQSLIDYRKKLELYRITAIEAYNSRIDQICKDLVKVESRVNTAFRVGDLSKNEKDNYDRRIAEERAECQTVNYDESQYWKMYGDFLNLYQSESTQSLADLDRCYVSDVCSSGQ